MSVWVCIPSIRPGPEAQRTIDNWREMGYKVAVYRRGEFVAADVLLVQPGEYNIGWACQINALVWHVLSHSHRAEWIVAGSDDIDPDPTKSANYLSLDCLSHFKGTLGVMQPTGDRGNNGIIDTAAASAWMGREFCERANEGRGPLWPEYRFYWADRELQEVAIKHGVFWQRPDLTQLHRHWSREPGATPPNHLREALANYTKYAKLFNERKAANFPGSDLLP